MNPVVGMLENSSNASSVGQEAINTSSPEGTADPEDPLSRPFGTGSSITGLPTLKRWAIAICPFGTETPGRRPGLFVTSGSIMKTLSSQRVLFTTEA
jgi:hypothetical protein